MAASVAGDAVVARQGVVAHQVEHAQAVGQRPGLGLVEPHQRGVDDELRVHRQVQRHIHRADERVTAIGIAAEVGLRHARHQVPDAPLAGMDGGDGQEEQVAPGHEGVGHAALGLLAVHGHRGVRQRVVPQSADEGRVHDLEVYAGLGGYGACQFYFLLVLLPVAEAQGVHFGKLLFGPKQAGGGVLSATEDD